MATATKERRKTSSGITLDLGEFKKAVSIAGHAVPSRHAKQVLTNLKIGNGLVIGTDLDCQIEVELLDAQCEPMLLPKDRLRAILDNSAGDTVTLTPDGATCIIKSRGCEWRLPTESADEFPLWEPTGLHQMLHLTGEEFMRAVGAVQYAIDSQSSRYALGGVFIECVGDDAWFVATDGRRLSIASVRREAATDDFVAQPKGMQKKAPVVPPEVLSWLCHNDFSEQTVFLSCDDNTISGNVGGVTVTARLIDGRFPKWRDVLDGEYRAAHMVARDHLQRCVKCAAVVATESSKGVRFAFDGDTLTLTARSSEAGESEVQCPVDSAGEPCTLTLDPKFVHDFLKPFGTDDEPCVKIHVAKADGKTLLKVGDDFTGVIMPLSEDA